MSKADDTANIPETVMISDETDSVHRRGEGIQPACAARLHNVDSVEWKLTQEPRTDPEARCGHPECFRGEQPVADGGEDLDDLDSFADPLDDTDADFVEERTPEPTTVLDEPEPVDHAADEIAAIVETLELSQQVESTAEGMADRAQFEQGIQRPPTTLAAAAVYLAGILHQHEDIAQVDVAEAADVSRSALRETYLQLGNDPEVLPNWYADTSEPEEPKDTDDAGILDRAQTWLESIRSDDTEVDDDEQD